MASFNDFFDFSTISNEDTLELLTTDRYIANKASLRQIPVTINRNGVSGILKVALKEGEDETTNIGFSSRLMPGTNEELNPLHPLSKSALDENYGYSTPDENAKSILVSLREEPKSVLFFAAYDKDGKELNIPVTGTTEITSEFIPGTNIKTRNRRLICLPSTNASDVNSYKVQSTRGTMPDYVIEIPSDTKIASITITIWGVGTANAEKYWLADVIQELIDLVPDNNQPKAKQLLVRILSRILNIAGVIKGRGHVSYIIDDSGNRLKVFTSRPLFTLIQKIIQNYNEKSEINSTGNNPIKFDQLPEQPAPTRDPKQQQQ